MVFKTVVPSPSVLGRCIPLVVRVWGMLRLCPASVGRWIFRIHSLSKCNTYSYLIGVSSLQMLQSIINGFLSFPCFTKPQHFLQSQISAFQCIGIEVACVEESVMNLNQKTVSVSNNVSIWCYWCYYSWRLFHHTECSRKKYQWP